MSDSVPRSDPSSSLPARPELCIRPPCLKRNNSAPPVDASAILPFICSFSAPRSFSSNGAKRSLSVRFNSSEPEAYLTHSSVQYDRTPIHCTRGGEQDLSMPPRGNWSEGEDEADENLSPISPCRDIVDDNDSEKRSNAEGEEADDDFQPWVGLRQRQAYSFTGAYSIAQDNPDAEIEQADLLAYRGLRSVGALCQRRALVAPSPKSAHTELPPVEGASDREQTTSYRLASMISPDATPMPSPSVARSMAASGGLSSSSITRLSAFGEQSRDVSYFSIEAETSTTSIDIPGAYACRPCSSRHRLSTSAAGLPGHDQSSSYAIDGLDALTHGDTCDLSVEALLGSGLADCIADPIARLTTMRVPESGLDFADMSAIDVGETSSVNKSGASPLLLREALAALPASSALPALALASSPMSSRSSSMDSFTRPTMTKLGGRAESLASSSGQSSPPTSWTESGTCSPDLFPAPVDSLSSSLAQRVPAMSLELPPTSLQASSGCSSTGSLTPPTSGGSSPMEETPRPKKAVDILASSSSAAALAPSCVKMGRNGKPKKTPEEVRAKREREKKREAERERRILGDDAGALGGF